MTTSSFHRVIKVRAIQRECLEEPEPDLVFIALSKSAQYNKFITLSTVEFNKFSSRYQSPRNTTFTNRSACQYRTVFIALSKSAQYNKFVKDSEFKTKVFIALSKSAQYNCTLIGYCLASEILAVCGAVVHFFSSHHKTLFKIPNLPYKSMIGAILLEFFTSD